MRLIDADELKKAIEQGECFSWDSHGKDDLCVRKKYIDNAPTVELDEGVIQSVLNKRCMTAVANEYLVALHGNRPHGEWIKIFSNPFTDGYICSVCGHKIQVTEQFLPKVTKCEVCGAEMKGGAE